MVVWCEILLMMVKLFSKQPWLFYWKVMHDGFANSLIHIDSCIIEGSS